MAVVRTDKWLAEAHGDPFDVCKYLTRYFPTASAADIHHHLMMFGMYRSAKQGVELCKQLYAKDVWAIAATEMELLRNEWNGPSVPVFIFPSDADNKELILEFNGKSGLSYADKLFLFISPYNTETEIKALLTHEYNHVCRLNKYPKREHDYTLLDTIVLEGLAEVAVEERFGKTSTSLWTSLYSEKQLYRLWKDIVYPHRHCLKESALHEKVLYGLGDYPHMAGYCVGYSLVRDFMRRMNLQSGDLLAIPSTDIAR